jgi:hypothetical protein
MLEYPAQYVVVRHRVRCCRQIDRQAHSDLQRTVQLKKKMKRKDDRREEEIVRQRERKRERETETDCVCVCVCVWERERERERENQRERKRLLWKSSHTCMMQYFSTRLYRAVSD